MPETADFALPPALPGTRETRSARFGRRCCDRLETGLATSSLSAGAALAGAAAVGKLRAALSGRWPSVGEVAALFGRGRFESRRIALGIAANEARTRLVLRRSSGRSLAPFAPLVSVRDEGAAAALRPPLVLLTAHVGALHLLAVGLDRFAARRVSLRWSPLHLPAAGEESAFTAGPVVSRSEALRRALDGLRSGKAVVTTLEGPHGSAEPGTLLGRPLDLGRGGFALARLGEVPIAPLAALWEGNRVRIEVGAPIAASAEAPAEMTRWFETLLRRSPRQMSLGLLRRLLQVPAVDSSGEDARAR